MASAKGSDWKPVRIIKANSPVCYQAMWVEDGGEPTFSEFDKKFNEYLCGVGVSSEARSYPEKGQIVAVRDPKDRRWYRGRVNAVMERIRQLDANVFLLDFPRELNVPIEWVRDIPERFMNYSFQSCILHLPGLAPCSVVLRPDLSASIGQVTKWNVATVDFVNRFIKAKKGAMVEVQSQIDQIQFNVKLYLTMGNSESPLCMNDVLINQEYAISIESTPDSESIKMEAQRVGDEIAQLQMETETKHQADQDDLENHSDVTTTSASKAQRRGASVCERLRPPVLDSSVNKKESYRDERCDVGEESTSSQASSSSALRPAQQPRKPPNDHLDILNQNASIQPILVCGQIPGNPIGTIDKLPFDPMIKSRMGHLGFCYPRTIQAYVWPAIIRGRNIVVISGRGSGQTIAYLMPLISNIKEGLMYADIQPNNEPLALILCATWRKAESIFKEGMRLLKGLGSIKLLHIHSGNGKNQNIQLLNGCDILVATPHALLRLLNAPDNIKLTGFSRLCHIVLDDADVLLSTFIEQVKEIFLKLKEMKRRKKDPTCNQIMTFCNRWTSELNRFIGHFMPSPLLFCSALCESMIYAGISPVVHTFVHDERLQKFVDEVLNPYLERKSGGAMVICVEESKHAKELHSNLKDLTGGTNLLLVTKMDIPHISDVRMRWAMSQKLGTCSILIVTDETLQILGIDDADCLVHYDIPKSSKAKFNGRFICLLKHLRKSEVISKEALAPSCVTHLIVTNKPRQNVLSLIRILKQANCPIPDELNLLSLGIYQTREENREPIALCHYLKAFGECTNTNICTDRHLLLESADAPSNWLLRGGYVKVHVTCVRNASRFYGRVVSFKDCDNTAWPGEDSEYLSLITDIGVYYAHLVNRVPLSSPKLGDVGAVALDTVFYRVKVLYKGLQEENVRQVQVFFLDEGFCRYVLESQVLYLPKEYADVPQQSYEIFLSNIAPVDNDVEWTPNAVEFVESSVLKKELTGKIQLSMGCTLWLNPVEKITKLKEKNAYVKEFELCRELLSNGYAMEKPDHLLKLEAFCSEMFHLSLPIRLDESSGKHLKEQTPTNVDCAFLPPVELVDVCLSFMEHPGRFFLQRFEFSKCFDDLMNEIQVHVKERPYTGMSEVCEGLLCLAPVANQPPYYRARILTTPDATRNHFSSDEWVSVFFVDYGDTCEVKAGNLLPLPSKFLWKLPLQAIECSLSGVRPINGDEWSEKASQCVQNAFIDNKMMSVRVTEQLGKNPSFPNNRYSVILYDADMFDVADNLVLEGYAEDDPSEHMMNSSQEAPITCESNQPANAVSDLDINQESGSIASNSSENATKYCKPVDTKIPSIKWADRLDKLCLKFMIADVKEQSMTVNGSLIIYSAIANGDHYAVQLELFDEVTKDEVIVARDSYVPVTLKKTSRKRWPRLTSKAGKLHYVSMDYDYWMDSSDEESNEIQNNWTSMYKSSEPNTQVPYRVGKPEACSSSDTSSDSDLESDEHDEDGFAFT